MINPNFKISKQTLEKFNDNSIQKLKKVSDIKLESKIFNNKILKGTIGIFNNLDKDINDLRLVADLSGIVTENSEVKISLIQKKNMELLKKSIFFEF